MRAGGEGGAERERDTHTLTHTPHPRAMQVFLGERQKGVWVDTSIQDLHTEPRFLVLVRGQRTK